VTEPPRAILQAPRFGKAKRRLPAAGQLAVDDAVRAIVADPLSGEPKTGALKGVRVVKFKVEGQQLLLAYQFQAKANRIEVLDVGPHENFYRDLQKYLDAR
jgi:hypothetical protein